MASIRHGNRWDLCDLWLLNCCYDQYSVVCYASNLYPPQCRKAAEVPEIFTKKREDEGND